jgi:hypothetical protein
LGRICLDFCWRGHCLVALVGLVHCFERVVVIVVVVMAVAVDESLLMHFWSEGLGVGGRLHGDYIVGVVLGWIAFYLLMIVYA